MAKGRKTKLDTSAPAPVSAPAPAPAPAAPWHYFTVNMAVLRDALKLPPGARLYQASHDPAEDCLIVTVGHASLHRPEGGKGRLQQVSFPPRYQDGEWQQV